jgi:hypothetical protein
VRLLLAVIVGLTAIQPTPASASGTGTGGVPSCQKVGVLQVQGGLGAVTALDGLASAQCVIPEGLPGTRWGPSQGGLANRPDGGAISHGADGQACSQREWEPVDVFWQGGQLWVSWVNDMSGDRISMPVDDTQRWLNIFRAQDGWMPLQKQGIWHVDNAATGAGHCDFTTAPGANTGTGVLCGFDNIQAVVPFPGCLQMTDPAVLRNPGGLDVGAVRTRIASLMGAFQALIQPGQISSMPPGPGLANPGLTQIGTCFFVSGANINRVPVSQQSPDQWFQVVLDGGAIGEGRHIFYTFAVRLSYSGTIWHFGDGSQQADALPTQCRGAASGAQISASHTYTQYSMGRMPGDVFQVTATESYTTDVWELWVDPTSGNVQTSFFADPLGPINLTVGPYPKGVVQEMGVPIAPSA